MSHYRCYHLDRTDHIVAFTDIECDTDDVARWKGFDLAEEFDCAMEVWRDGEKICRIPKT